MTDFRLALHSAIDTFFDSIEATPGPGPVDPPVDPPSIGALVICQGETLYLPPSAVLEPPEGSPLIFENAPPYTVISQMPSYKGALVGEYDDGSYARVTAPRNSATGTHLCLYRDDSTSGTVAIRISSVKMPERLFPAYCELSPDAIKRAHGLPDNVAFQGPKSMAYIKLLRSFGVEPIKQNISHFPSTDFDRWKEYSASFRQLVIDGAIAPPCLFGPSPGIRPSPELVQKLTTEFPHGWVYAWDEGELDPADSARALDYLRYLKNCDPAIQTMITRQASPDFSPVVNHYCPVIDWFDRPGKVPRSLYDRRYGLYTSNMAQGNTINKTRIEDVRPASGTPMFVFDAPTVHRVAFPLIAALLDADFCLYYSATENLRGSLTPNGLYDYGGQGDGTLFHVDGSHNIVPSRRLAEWHCGIQLATLALMVRDKNGVVPSPVADGFMWSKNMDDYANYRKTLIEWLEQHP